MSTIAEDLSVSTGSAERLRLTYGACRLSFSPWLGTRKTLTDEQKESAAMPFGATGDWLSAGKKLFDTKAAAYKAVTAIKSQAASYWKGNTLPYPEAGIRLIRQRDVEAFADRMGETKAELSIAVAALDRELSDLRNEAAGRLGSLYCPDDYPSTLIGCFGVEWDFPSVEPPDYLRELNPAVYAQESARVAARFDEAVRLAEEAFTEELAKMVAHLTDCLSNDEEGKPKVFRDSAFENIHEFVARFRRLNVGSSSQLDAAVDAAENALKGTNPRLIRNHAYYRQPLAAAMSAVSAQLEGMIVARPRRRVERPVKTDLE